MDEMAGGDSSISDKKRKADDGLEQAPKRIKALDQDVVNKIAAGEIIVAPVHALKELIENAVDAGSTAIEVVVKEGGLKLLQITDNGHGIHREDMAILCERFTTSKLKTFEDLSEIGTYGFRGEALASISHIAHLTITTKTADSSCAWRAYYGDGKLIPAKPGQSADPKPIAGRGGTQITVEDLFYNVPSRQRAFRSPSEEYAKILDVVGRYAVHCAGVAFSCKKFGDPSASISTPSNARTIDTIRQIHGTAVANEMIEFGVADAKYGFEARGLTSNANFGAKKTTILLFINHRSVESTGIKKSIDQMYAAYLPKGRHPFLYLDLEVDPHRVDVNVHPTKREVNFLNEDEIIEIICNDIRERLLQVDTSRTFTTSSLMPPVMRSLSSNDASMTNTPKTGSSIPSRPAENNLVRTDPNVRKITSMLHPSDRESSLNDIENPDSAYEIVERPRVECRLTAVKQLRADVRADMHGGLTDIFATLTYCGVVDPWRRIVAMQSGVKLFLVDYGFVSKEYFYQLGLSDFNNFGTIKFEEPLSIRNLISIAVKHEKDAQHAENEGIDLDSVPAIIADQLIAKRAMLLEYFSMNISPTGELLSIPLLLKGYSPSLAKLPRLLLRLGPHVRWEDEQGCYDTFLRELASFYAPEQLPPYSSGATTNDASDLPNSTDVSASAHPEMSLPQKKMEKTLEHVLFPAFRSRLVATNGLLKGVLEVADLKGLYKVFERC